MRLCILAMTTVEGNRAPAPAHLVRTDGTLVLIDTGFGREARMSVRL